MKNFEELNLIELDLVAGGDAEFTQSEEDAIDCELQPIGGDTPLGDDSAGSGSGSRIRP